MRTTEHSIEITGDGSVTLRHAVTGDTYHSMRGAVGESRHVFVENGFNSCRRDPLSILEVGFGTGLNAWLTLLEATKNGREVDYTAIEPYPINETLARGLHYSSDPQFMMMHLCEEGEKYQITESFRFLKIYKRFAETEFLTKFDLVYFDAFAPSTQPELWTEEVFNRLYGMMNDGGVLVTYSAKGDVKRAMRSAGFEVERLPGALGKRHMLKARKK